jgi:hypothetical protein
MFFAATYSDPKVAVSTVDCKLREEVNDRLIGKVNDVQIPSTG